jgi:hypothetical protein
MVDVPFRQVMFGLQYSAHISLRSRRSIRHMFRVSLAIFQSMMISIAFLVTTSGRFVTHHFESFVMIGVTRILMRSQITSSGGDLVYQRFNTAKNGLRL